MTKEKLEKEASNWLRKYLLCCNCEKKCNCIDSNSYCEEQVLKAYVDSAEPREKRIADLEVIIDQSSTALMKEKLKNYKQLTKAKELLNEFMRIGKASDEDFEHDYSELIAEAEQFLNSEVEK